MLRPIESPSLEAEKKILSLFELYEREKNILEELDTLDVVRREIQSKYTEDAWNKLAAAAKPIYDLKRQYQLWKKKDDLCLYLWKFDFFGSIAFEDFVNISDLLKKEKLDLALCPVYGIYISPAQRSILSDASFKIGMHYEALLQWISPQEPFVQYTRIPIDIVPALEPMEEEKSPSLAFPFEPIDIEMSDPIFSSCDFFYSDW